MDRAKFVSFVFGLLGGSFFAMSLNQYQNIFNPILASSFEYSVGLQGATSYYFVMLPQTKNETDLELDKSKDSEKENGNRGDGKIDLNKAKESNSEGHPNLEKRTSEKLGLLRLQSNVNPDLIPLANSLDRFDPFHSSDLLRDKIRILCIVVLQDASYLKALQRTWTNHCNQTLLITKADLDLGFNSWSRTKMAITTAHDRFAGLYDWFVFVPENGFVVIENLRYLLLKHQVGIPGYLGHVFSGPNGGASAIVLSQQALKILHPRLPDCNSGYFGGADVGAVLESCFQTLGIKAKADGRDASGVFRFQMRVPNTNLPNRATSTMHWNWKYISHPETEDPVQCCSEYTISFHNVGAKEMYLLEYMVYHLRPFGIGTYTCPAVAVDGG